MCGNGITTIDCESDGAPSGAYVFLRILGPIELMNFVIRRSLRSGDYFREFIGFILCISSLLLMLICRIKFFFKDL